MCFPRSQYDLDIPEQRYPPGKPRGYTASDERNKNTDSQKYYTKENRSRWTTSQPQ